MCKHVRQPEISKMILGRTFCNPKNVWLRKIEISDKGRALYNVMDHSHLLHELDQENYF